MEKLGFSKSEVVALQTLCDVYDKAGHLHYRSIERVKRNNERTPERPDAECHYAQMDVDDIEEIRNLAVSTILKLIRDVEI